MASVSGPWSSSRLSTVTSWPLQLQSAERWRPTNAIHRARVRRHGKQHQALHLPRKPHWQSGGAQGTPGSTSNPLESTECFYTDIITGRIWPHGLSRTRSKTRHMIPPIIPLTSDTPRLHRMTDEISRSRVSPTERKGSHNTINHPAHQRRAALTPACFALRHANALSTKAVQIRMALRLHGRNFATPGRLSQTTSLPKWHGATQMHFSTKAVQIRMALRHHERNFATRPATH